MKATRKEPFPVEKVRRYLEPGPVVLLSSAWRGERNIMTLGWHDVPPLFSSTSLWSPGVT